MVTVIPILARALGAVLKNQEKRLGDPEIQGSITTMKITELLESAGKLRRVLETGGELLLQTTS